MTTLVFKDITSGKEYPMAEIQDISITSEIECEDVISPINLSDEISFTASNPEMSFFALVNALFGVQDTNNWRKMHGGVMRRKVKR